MPPAGQRRWQVPIDQMLKLPGAESEAVLQLEAVMQEQPDCPGGSEKTEVTSLPGPTVQPLFWSGPQLAKAVGVSLASFHRHLAANRIGPKPVRLGGRLLF